MIALGVVEKDELPVAREFVTNAGRGAQRSDAPAIETPDQRREGLLEIGGDCLGREVDENETVPERYRGFVDSGAGG